MKMKNYEFLKKILQKQKHQKDNMLKPDEEKFSQMPKIAAKTKKPLF